ncbi:hypothetical protein AB6A40_001112 [Gnathostoma spinigerum]|uniref:Uncharacterized protein n=1 Tax=Gnathostoma spinigerum TaxID=75299 RepID=A0ABD6E3L3_9BILA
MSKVPKEGRNLTPAASYIRTRILVRNLDWNRGRRVTGGFDIRHSASAISKTWRSSPTLHISYSFSETGLVQQTMHPHITVPVFVRCTSLFYYQAASTPCLLWASE